MPFRQQTHSNCFIFMRVITVKYLQWVKIYPVKDFLCFMHTIVVVSYAAVVEKEEDEVEEVERSFSLCTSIKFMLCMLPSTNITIERENYAFTIVKELLNIAYNSRRELQWF